MNNEPVAWMETYKGEPNNLDWDKNNLNYGSEFHDVIPLYTHPAELTDEEIGQLKGEWYRGDYASFYDLVRAILRKAQEK